MQRCYQTNEIFVKEYDQIYGQSFKSTEMQCQMTLAQNKNSFSFVYCSRGGIWADKWGELKSHAIAIVRASDSSYLRVQRITWLKCPVTSWLWQTSCIWQKHVFSIEVTRLLFSFFFFSSSQVLRILTTPFLDCFPTVFSCAALTRPIGIQYTVLSIQICGVCLLG